MRKIIIQLIATSAFAIWAAPASSEENKPRTLQPKPSQTVERPFGNAPNRTPRRRGKKCVTPTVTCALGEARSVGSDCACAGGAPSPAVQGRVAP
jgi:hypothetical protein